MTVAVIREKLKSYVDDVDDKKVKALYTLLQDDIEDNAGFVFSKEQMQILEEEDKLHTAGKTPSYSWEEAKEVIRGKKKM